MVSEHRAGLCHRAGSVVDVPGTAGRDFRLGRARRSRSQRVLVVAAQWPHRRARDCSRCRDHAIRGNVGSPSGGVDFVLPLARLGERCARGGQASARQAAPGPARGLLSHLDGRSEAKPSSLVRVRTIKRSDRPPLLLPQQVQAILDGCAVYDPQTGEWQGNLRDRFLFALLAETGMRLGEALGMRVNEFVMGRGGTPYVQVVPREDNPNGARVKMLRPRRVYVGI